MTERPIDYDLCIIGGGINGAGIARDAAGRGLKTLLIEARDLASATSSSSTKLIHGGLRYLEYYDFKLVRESLKERETLLTLAPHIIWPMKFVLPHDASQRPRWMIRAGLFLYDHLAKRKILPGSHSVLLEHHAYGAPLKNIYRKGFCYSDCWVEDSRLVILNAISARDKGADIWTQTRCAHIEHADDHWHVSLDSTHTKRPAQIRSKMLINAAGPWVRDVLETSNITEDDQAIPKIKLVKGSHIIVPRRYEGEHSYILQQKDGRIVFAIPYEHDFTLIGTTEEDFEGDTYDAAISDEETQYLIECFNASFERPISRKDITSTYSGVRPLFDDGDENATSTTRDYRIYHHDNYAAPFLSVFGGKLTTYRTLSEDVVTMLCRLNGSQQKPWSASQPLPGGDIKDTDFESFYAQKVQHYSFLDAELIRRYARAYGTRIDVMLQNAKTLNDMGTHYGENVYEAEIHYLITHEWAQNVEDVLRRRSKLELHISSATKNAISAAWPELMKGASP